METIVPPHRHVCRIRDVSPLLAVSLERKSIRAHIVVSKIPLNVLFHTQHVHVPCYE